MEQQIASWLLLIYWVELCTLLPSSPSLGGVGIAGKVTTLAPASDKLGLTRRMPQKILAAAAGHACHQVWISINNPWD
jgi:hypothetical protein